MGLLTLPLCRTVYTPVIHKPGPERLGIVGGYWHITLVCHVGQNSLYTSHLQTWPCEAWDCGCLVGLITLVCEVGHMVLLT